MNKKIMWILSVVGLIVVLVLAYFLIFNSKAKKNEKLINDYDTQLKILDNDLNSLEQKEDEQNLEVQKDTIEEDTAVDELQDELNNLDNELSDLETSESDLNQLFQ
jgi:uncharacterized protein YoxC